MLAFLLMIRCYALLMPRYAMVAAMLLLLPVTTCWLSLYAIIIFMPLCCCYAMLYAIRCRHAIIITLRCRAMRHYLPFFHALDAMHTFVAMLPLPHAATLPPLLLPRFICRFRAFITLAAAAYGYCLLMLIF